jgi:hypothetical protein
MSEQSCDSCRFYETAPMDSDRRSFCIFTITEPLPFWISAALEQATDFVKPNDGRDCEAWAAKP